MIRGAKALRRLYRSGLFWRFLLIGIAVLAPLAGALVQLAGDERRMTIEATRKRAELLISYAIDSQDHVIDEAGSVLRFLADVPEVRSGGPSCDAFLKRYLGLQRWMMALLKITTRLNAGAEQNSSNIKPVNRSKEPVLQRG